MSKETLTAYRYGGKQCEKGKAAAGLMQAMLQCSNSDSVWVSYSLTTPRGVHTGFAVVTGICTFTVDNARIYNAHLNTTVQQGYKFKTTSVSEYVHRM